MEKLFWEDFPIGKLFRFGHYQVRAAEIIAFGKQFDPLPHHIGAEEAANSPLGGLCASGGHSLGMAQRMFCDHIFSQSGLIAGSGIEKYALHIPVIAGYTLTVNALVVASEAHWKKHDRGWVKFEVQVFQQDNIKVFSYDSRILFLKKTNSEVKQTLL